MSYSNLTYYQFLTFWAILEPTSLNSQFVRVLQLLRIICVYYSMELHGSIVSVRGPRAASHYKCCAPLEQSCTRYMYHLMVRGLRERSSSQLDAFFWHVIQRQHLLSQGALEEVNSPHEESVKLLVLALCPVGFVRPPESTSGGKVLQEA